MWDAHAQSDHITLVGRHIKTQISRAPWKIHNFRKLFISKNTFWMIWAVFYRDKTQNIKLARKGSQSRQPVLTRNRMNENYWEALPLKKKKTRSATPEKIMFPKKDWELMKQPNERLLMELRALTANKNGFGEKRKRSNWKTTVSDTDKCRGKESALTPKTRRLTRTNAGEKKALWLRKLDVWHGQMPGKRKRSDSENRRLTRTKGK